MSKHSIIVNMKHKHNDGCLRLLQVHLGQFTKSAIITLHCLQITFKQLSAMSVLMCVTTWLVSAKGTIQQKKQHANN
jgi:hypothetical protein